MDTAISIPSNAGAVGLLIGAVGTLWGWYVYTVKQFEEKLNKRDEKMEKVIESVTKVVEHNTVAHTQSTEVLRSLSSSNTQLHQTITKYIIESAGGHNNDN